MADNNNNGCGVAMAMLFIGGLLMLIEEWWGIIIFVIGILALIGIAYSTVKGGQESGTGKSTITIEYEESGDDSDDDADAYAENGCRQLHTIIVGTRFENSDGTNRKSIIRATEVGSRLKLVPYLYDGEPAVAIHNSLDFMMGNMRRELAEEFYDKVNRGQIAGVYLNSKTMVDGAYKCGITINIRNTVRTEETKNTTRACNACGETLQPGVKFCGMCGQAYRRQDEYKASTAFRYSCTACGRPLGSLDSICAYCGSRAVNDASGKTEA